LALNTINTDGRIMQIVRQRVPEMTIIDVIESRSLLANWDYRAERV